MHTLVRPYHARAEQNYSVIQRECLALVHAIKQLRHYLLGRFFVVITDHEPLITVVIYTEESSINSMIDLGIAALRFIIVREVTMGILMGCPEEHIYLVAKTLVENSLLEDIKKHKRCNHSASTRSFG